MAGTKTANVNCRISEDVKSKAEDILKRMGLPRSVAIDMFYRRNYSVKWRLPELTFSKIVC